MGNGVGLSLAICKSTCAVERRVGTVLFIKALGGKVAGEAFSADIGGSLSVGRHSEVGALPRTYDVGMKRQRRDVCR